jgi:hypothetical protein
MLFWTAVINGIVAVPIMIAVMFFISNGSGAPMPSVPVWLRTLGWMASALMALAVCLFVATSLWPGG